MLNEKIRDTIQQLRQVLPPEMSALVEQGAGEISALDIVERAAKVGDKASSFNLNNQRGEPRSLADYLSQGPLVLTFYRGVWCPYCNLQLKEYSDHLEAITSAGGQLIAISPEKPDALGILNQSSAPQEVIDMVVSDVPFDVLYDAENVVAETFGLVFELPDSHKQLLKGIGVDIEQLTGSTSFTFPDPATYVIDTQGEICWAFVPNNYRKRAEVGQIVNALNASKA